MLRCDLPKRGLQIADHLVRVGCLLFMFKSCLRPRDLPTVAKGVQVPSPVSNHLLPVVVPKKLVRVQQVTRIVGRTFLGLVLVITHSLIVRALDQARAELINGQLLTLYRDRWTLVSFTKAGSTKEMVVALSPTEATLGCDGRAVLHAA